MSRIAHVRSLLYAGAVALTFSSAPPAVAEVAPAIDFTSPGIVLSNTSFTLGYQFTANAGAVVDGLAVWNDFSVTPGSADVGLWDAAGTLLASTTVTTSSPTIGTADWSYTPIAPIALTLGAMYVVGSFGSDAQVAFFNSGITVDPRITYVQDAFIASSALQFPSQTVSNPIELADFGANVILGPIPEPSTWAMTLAGFAAVGLLGAVRARKGIAAA